MNAATISSTATASLARRLRELRMLRFDSARLTQSEVAQALSEEEPAAISTLSSWENVRTPTLPSRSRLSAYARFFATERSLETYNVSHRFLWLQVFASVRVAALRTSHGQ